MNVGAPAQPARYATFQGDGQGVKVDSVTRFRDQFMEIQAAIEHGSMASMNEASSTMNAIQQLFNEPSDSGIQAQLSDLWAGFDDVANNPADGAVAYAAAGAGRHARRELQLGQQPVDRS